MTVDELVSYLDSILKPYYKESYDNVGLIVGNRSNTVKGVLTTTDITNNTIDEAIQHNLNVIVSHHPLIFNGIKSVTTSGATGNMIIKLITNGISVYTAHTNLDNLDFGVNARLAERLGLRQCSILHPVDQELRKLVVYVPTLQASMVREALYDAGAGHIGNYDRCSYNLEGTGTFRPLENSNPYCGEVNTDHEEPESRVEVIYEKRIEQKLIKQLKQHHPYEEPAYDCIPLCNPLHNVGAGMVGTLDKPQETTEFLKKVKETLGIPTIRCSELCRSTIQRVAICGGSGTFLIGDAIQSKADIYLTADIKYHDFQNVENKMILADIGHFESEQFAKELLYDIISKKFSTFACRIAQSDKGYVCYI